MKVCLRQLFFILLIIQSSIVLASFTTTSSVKKQSEHNRNMMILASLGLPLPSSGVEIVSVDSIGVPESEQQKMLSQNKEMQRNGYFEDSTSRAKELLNLQYTIPFQKKRYASEVEPWKTHI